MLNMLVKKQLFRHSSLLKMELTHGKRANRLVYVCFFNIRLTKTVILLIFRKNIGIDWLKMDILSMVKMGLLTC